MNALRSQAIDIIVGLPEPYMAYALDILKNVKQMSAIHLPAEKVDAVPVRLHKRDDSARIQAAIDSLAGALPPTDMTLADFREERLGKYAAIG